MAVSTERVFWVVGLAAGCVALGCSGRSVRQPQSLTQATAPHPKMSNDTQPGPSLRIPADPTPAPAATPTNTATGQGQASPVSYSTVAPVDTRAFAAPPPAAPTPARSDSPALPAAAPSLTAPAPAAPASESKPFQVPPSSASVPPRMEGGPFQVPPPVAAPAAVPRKPSAPALSTAGPATATPSGSAAVDSTAELRRLYRAAAERIATMDSYIARLRRREQVNGKDKPEEILMFKFRKEPFSVYFKWLGDQAKGREVIYVKGRHEGKIHTLLAAGDMPFAPAGKRVAMAPDSIFVRSASRHSINESGIGNAVERFGLALQAIESGSQKFGTVKYIGLVKRPEYDVPLEGVQQVVPAGSDPRLPRGGTRLGLFYPAGSPDPASGLPVVIATYDHTGHEVEYYCYDRIQYPVHLDDEDFDPDRLWGKQK